jgi:hypothetical protein
MAIGSAADAQTLVELAAEMEYLPGAPAARIATGFDRVLALLHGALRTTAKRDR